MRTLLLPLLCCASVLRAETLPLITETHQLEAGWNAVYLEVTPVDGLGSLTGSVTKIGCYLPKAMDSTAAWDIDGEPVTAKPVCYSQWVAGHPEASDLETAVGGLVYLMYAPAAGSFTVSGEPRLPFFAWRRTTGADGGMAVLAAPSFAEGIGEKYPKDYFAEGPWGAKGTAYEVRGMNATPNFVPFFVNGKVKRGRAYGFTAEKDGTWPGVIDVRGIGPGGLVFAAGENAQSFTVRNAGTRTRDIRIDLTAVSGYDATAFGDFPVVLTNVTAGESRTVYVNADPVKRTGETPAAALIEVSDALAGGTGMRVRFAVKAEPATGLRQDAGFYIGSYTLDRVGGIPAGGRVEGALMLRIDSSGVRSLVQRMAFGRVGGKTSVYRDLDAAPAESRDSLRRYSSTVLDPRQPEIAEAGGFYRWTVAYDSPSNPYYHAHHPDHDGVSYDSNGGAAKLPDGANFEEYKVSVKPELFSITNSVSLAFDVQPSVWNPDGVYSGKITWRIDGLRADVPGGLVCEGDFRLERFSNNVNWSEDEN